MTEDLFGAMDAPEDMTRPLAVRMRPSSVDEVVGQSRVLGQGSPLRRLANPASKGSLTAPSSIILFWTSRSRQNHARLYCGQTVRSSLRRAFRSHLRRQGRAGCTQTRP